MHNTCLSKSEIIKRLKDKGIGVKAPVEIEKIREFEMLNGVKLPNELVEFYTTVSNGCTMIDGFELYAFEDWKFDLVRIKQPFSFTSYWVWENENSQDLDFSIIENGIIELIDIGDSQTWNIVVNGNDYGNMWFYTDVGIQPACPEMNFMQWFVFWLDGNEDYFYGFQY